LPTTKKLPPIDPQNGWFWARFADCLKAVKFTSYSDDLVHDLLQMLEQSVAHEKSLFLHIGARYIDQRTTGGRQ
jgi:hypothetical protein